MSRFCSRLRVFFLPRSREAKHGKNGQGRETNNETKAIDNYGGEVVFPFRAIPYVSRQPLGISAMKSTSKRETENNSPRKLAGLLGYFPRNMANLGIRRCIGMLSYCMFFLFINISTLQFLFYTSSGLSSASRGSSENQRLREIPRECTVIEKGYPAFLGQVI